MVDMIDVLYFEIYSLLLSQLPFSSLLFLLALFHPLTLFCLLFFALFLSLVTATPLGKNKNIARASSLHHGVILPDGFLTDQVDSGQSGQLVDKTIIKKGWEPAALYIFGDKSLLRVTMLFTKNQSK